MPKVTRINAPRPTILRPVPKPRLKGGVVNLGAYAGSRAKLRPQAGGRGPAGPPGTSDGVWIRPESFGSHSTSGDNRTIVQAAIDAAMNQGGGAVLLDPSQDWGWDGELTIRDGVSLHMFAGYGSKHALKALSSDALLHIGDWTDTDGTHPARIQGLRIDGNGTGDTDGLVRIQGVFPTIEDLYVTGAAGHQVIVDAAQNTSIRSMVSELAGGAAMVLTNGAGGYIFENCHLRSSDLSLLVTDDAGGNGYPFGPAHINFIGGILETYTDGTALAHIDGGSLKFWGTGFSVNGASVMADDCALRISNDAEVGISTFVEFLGCNFNGGDNEYDTIRIVGNQVIAFSGETYLQQTARFLVADGGTPIVRTFGSFVEGDNVTAFTGTEGGGATVSFASEQTMPLDFRQRGDQPFVLSTRRAADGDTGLRMFIDQDGSIGYADGTTFVPVAGISYDAANDVIRTTGGLRTTGRRIEDLAAQFTAGAITFDSQASSAHALILSGNVTSMTITHEVDGAELELWIGWITGTETVVWPTNMRFANSSPPTAVASTYTIMRFRYVAGNSLWMECRARVTTPYT